MSLERERNLETGRFVSSGPAAWQVFMKEHECVKEWLEIRPWGTRKQYGRKLMKFCEETSISPEEFLSFDRFKARNIVWKYAKPFINESTSKAKNNLAALKSFYRSKDGETLPFDSARGGKHYFNTKRRKKAAMEHVPSKAEMYRIIDASSNIRDKSMLLVLFQSGVRVNALCHLTFKDVKEQLCRQEGPKIPLRLRVSDEIDTKLRGYSINFYDTFLQGEAVEALKAYCDSYHKDGDENEALFYSKLGNPINETAVWEMLKRCVRRAGLDPKTIWVHTIRKAFKRVVRRANIDDDFKEAIMGHVLPGSRENYFSRQIPKEIEENYMKADFSREIPESEVQRLRERLKEHEETLDLVTREFGNIMTVIAEKLGDEATLKIMREVKERLERPSAEKGREKP